MTRMVVTGVSGQVAVALARQASASDVEIVRLGRPDLDLCDPASMHRSIGRASPDIIVSAAAYTAVDQAEIEPQLVHTVNAEAPRILAEIARQLGVPIIHLSTDYVFDGRLGRPYREDDTVNPLGVYGASKLAGEIALRDCTDNHVILRTSWIYSAVGHNFVRSMLRLAHTRPSIRVVADQFGSPTSANDLAGAILSIASQLMASGDAALRGTFHVAGAGTASWADFATAIFEQSGLHHGPSAMVVAIPSSDYPTRAQRPADSRLCTDKLEAVYRLVLPDWRLSLAATVEELHRGQDVPVPMVAGSVA